MLRRIPVLPDLLGLARLLPLGIVADGAPPVLHRRCRVDGRVLTYGEVIGRHDDGDAGPTVVLVHGWALAHPSYKRAAQALAARGYHVLVPDLPGFGGSTDLRFTKVNLESFARSLEGFLRNMHERQGGRGGLVLPVHVVGHSLGGAVGVRLAHDAPLLVASVVLVDAASGVTWSRSEHAQRLMSERPIWDWALHLLNEFPLSEFPAAATPVVRDVAHNLVWHLPNLGLAAHMTRRSDIRSELKAIIARGVPVSVVWAERDRVVTRACFDDQCEAVGCSGTVVQGNHGWPLADPVSFGRVISELLPRRSDI
jgi:pimeloyl-ACP methyl ester carboxylesterase